MARGLVREGWRLGDCVRLDLYDMEMPLAVRVQLLIDTMYNITYK